MSSQRGKVKWYETRRGFGFITPDGSSKDVFVHHTNIIGQGLQSLSQGEEVTFEVKDGEKGPVALNVQKQPRQTEEPTS